MLTGHLSFFKKYLAGISLLSALCFSCENVIDIDIAPQPPKIVLNGLLNPDSCFSVHVSRSHFVLDNLELESLWDARVSVYEGDKQLGVLQHQDSGYYRLEGVFPQPGKRYTLRAEYEGMEPVSATETVLSPPDDVQLEVEKFTELTGFGSKRIKYRFTFMLEDPPGEKNYYLFRAIQKIPLRYSVDNDPEDEGFYTFLLFTESSDPNMELLYHSNSGLVLRDTYFDGQSYEGIIETRFNSLREGSEQYLSMYRISESAYLYFKSSHENYEAWIQVFAEPVRVYSNVEGGYGIWLSVAGKMTRVDK